MTAQIPLGALELASDAVKEALATWDGEPSKTYTKDDWVALCVLKAVAPHLEVHALVSAADAVRRQKNLLQGLARVRIATWLTDRAGKVVQRG